MILQRYITAKVIKTTLVVLFVVALFALSKKLIVIANKAVVGEIPVDFIAPLMAVQLPELLELLLPLSLFLGMIIAFGR